MANATVLVLSPCGGMIYQTFSWKRAPLFSWLPVCLPLCGCKHNCAVQVTDGGSRTRTLWRKRAGERGREGEREGERERGRVKEGERESQVRGVYS